MTSSRLKGALGLLGLVAACGVDGSVVAPSIELDATRGDAAPELPPPSAYSTAMQTVDALALLPELSRSALEAALGVSLSVPTVRAGVQLELSEFRATGRISPSTPFDVNPNVPPEGTLTFRDRTPTQTTLYEFTAQSQRLTGVILVRLPVD